MSKKDEIISKLVTFFNNVPKNTFYTYSEISNEIGMHFNTLETNLEELRQWEGLNLKFIQTKKHILVSVQDDPFETLTNQINILTKKIENIEEALNIKNRR